VIFMLISAPNRWEQCNRSGSPGQGLLGVMYFDLNVRHFMEKLREEHAIELAATQKGTVFRRCSRTVKGAAAISPSGSYSSPANP
jgi:hypothetical protein